MAVFATPPWTSARPGIAIASMSHKLANNVMVLAVLAVIYSGALEFAQSFVPGRHARVGDFMTYAWSACLMLVFCDVILRKLDSRQSRGPEMPPAQCRAARAFIAMSQSRSREIGGRAGGI